MDHSRHPTTPATCTWLQSTASRGQSPRGRHTANVGKQTELRGVRSTYILGVRMGSRP